MPDRIFDIQTAAKNCNGSPPLHRALVRGTIKEANRKYGDLDTAQWDLAALRIAET